MHSDVPPLEDRREPQENACVSTDTFSRPNVEQHEPGKAFPPAIALYITQLARSWKRVHATETFSPDSLQE